MLTEEQAKQIKEQIAQQIDSTFPEDKKADAKEKLQTMNSEQLEQFLEQNNMVSRQGGQETGEQQCIFCSIISGDVDSHKVGENSDAIAILEINPISEGHTIILPKEHSSEIPKNAEKLVEEISKLLKKKLKSKDVLISPANLFGHEIVNVVPVYKDETIQSQRKKANQEELEKTLKKILQEKEKPIKKAKPKKIKEKLWIPKRIP